MKIQGKRERRRRRNVARLMKFEKLTRTKAEAIAKQVDLTEQLETPWVVIVLFYGAHT